MCACAIDGTHIPILAPRENHTEYVNRKGFHSIIMQAVTDCNLGMGRYRYQILDTFDTSAWKESIDTGKKYRYFDTPSLRYRSIVVSGFIIEIARRW